MSKKHRKLKVSKWARRVVLRLIRNAYLNGFADSGEGWNMDYPFERGPRKLVNSPLDNAKWVKNREKYVRQIKQRMAR